MFKNFLLLQNQVSINASRTCLQNSQVLVRPNISSSARDQSAKKNHTNNFQYLDQNIKIIFPSNVFNITQ